MASPEVIDLQGKSQPWSYLVDTYGHLEYLEAQAYPKFQLTRVEETEGPAILQVLVLDEQGRPAASQPVCLSWPSLQEPDGNLPEVPSTATRSRWTTRGVSQRVDASGTTGFGLGTSSWIRDRAVGGPYTCFVLSPAAHADGLAHFGWLGGTEHRGPGRLTFQLVPEQGGAQPQTGDLTAVLAALAALDAKMTALAKHLGLEL